MTLIPALAFCSFCLALDFFLIGVGFCTEWRFVDLRLEEDGLFGIGGAENAGIDGHCVSRCESVLSADITRVSVLSPFSSLP